MRAYHSLRRSLGRQGMIGAATLVVIAGIAVYGLALPDSAGRERVAEPYERPRDGLPLGADDLGRDLLQQLIVGAGTSLALAFLVATFVTLLGALVGGTAGLGPRWLSITLMRGVDVMLILPELILFILAAAFLGQSFWTRATILALILWPVPARVLRSGVLAAWSRGHLEVARGMGAPRWWLLVRHGSYLIGPLLIPVFVRAAKVTIIYDATLSFLGLGDPTSPSWGTTLYWVEVNGVFLTDAWLWWALPPGAAIALTVLALALIGVAVEQRINPALRQEVTAT